MDKELTLENIGKLIDTKLTSLTELMIVRFDDVYRHFDTIETRLDKIDFNTSGQER